VQYASLINTVKLLGAFTKCNVLESTPGVHVSGDPVFLEYFSSTTSVKQFAVTPSGVPQPLIDACFVFRCLYDMAVDHFDRLVGK